MNKRQQHSSCGIRRGSEIRKISSVTNLHHKFLPVIRWDGGLWAQPTHKVCPTQNNTNPTFHVYQDLTKIFAPPYRPKARWHTVELPITHTLKVTVHGYQWDNHPFDQDVTVHSSTHVVTTHHNSVMDHGYTVPETPRATLLANQGRHRGTSLPRERPFFYVVRPPFWDCFLELNVSQQVQSKP